jgi:hypothetical protein
VSRQRCETRTTWTQACSAATTPVYSMSFCLMGIKSINLHNMSVQQFMQFGSLIFDGNWSPLSTLLHWCSHAFSWKWQSLEPLACECLMKLTPISLPQGWSKEGHTGLRVRNESPCWILRRRDDLQTEPSRHPSKRNVIRDKRAEDVASASSVRLMHVMLITHKNSFIVLL